MTTQLQVKPDTVTLPEGVSDQPLTPRPPNKARVKNALSRLAKMCPEGTRAFVLLGKDKNPVYQGWNEPSCLLDEDRAYCSLYDYRQPQDYTPGEKGCGIPGHCLYHVSAKAKGIPGVLNTPYDRDLGLLEKDGKLHHVGAGNKPGEPYLAKLNECHGIGIVAAQAGWIAIDVDGLSAINWLTENDLYQMVLDATNNGFAWTSGKPYRWQVLVKATPEILALFPSDKSVVKPDPENALEIRYGTKCQSALPGSWHPGNGDGEPNTYRQLKVNPSEPQALPMEFWETVASAYKAKQGERVSTLEGDVDPENVEARRAELYKSSLHVGDDDRGYLLKPVCHDHLPEGSTSGNSLSFFTDNGVLYCHKCGILTPEKEALVDQALYEKDRRHLTPFRTKRHPVDRSAPKLRCERVEGGEPETNVTGSVALSDALSDVVEVETTDVVSPEPVEAEVEVTAYADHTEDEPPVEVVDVEVVSRLPNRTNLPPTSREFLDLLLLSVTDVDKQLELWECYAAVKQSRYSAAKKKSMIERFLDDVPVVWVESEGKYYRFDADSGVWIFTTKKYVAHNLIRNWASRPENEGEVLSTTVVEDLENYVTTNITAKTDSNQQPSFMAYQEGVKDRPKAFSNCYVTKSGKQIPLEDGARFYARKKASMIFDPSATEFDYLRDWLVMFAGSEAKAGILIAFLGCCVYGVGADKHQRVLNLYGLPGSGKGDFTTLCEMVSEFPKAQSLSQIENGSHAMEGFDQSDLVVMGDESTQPRTLENIKKISGNTAVTINVKQKSSEDQTRVKVRANLILCQNDPEYLSLATPEDKRAFERRQFVIQVTQCAVVPGHGEKTSSEHEQLLHSQLPALVNYIYANLSPEFCQDVISRAESYCPELVSDKAVLKVATATGVDRLINERLTYCPEGADSVLVIAQIKELAEEYGIKGNPNSIKQKLVTALQMWKPIKDARLEWLKSHPGKETEAFDIVAGGKRTVPGRKGREGKTSVCFTNINIKLTEGSLSSDKKPNFAPLKPDELLDSFTPTRDATTHDLTQRLLDKLPRG